jgi:hypothetical protein
VKFKESSLITILLIVTIPIVILIETESAPTLKEIFTYLFVYIPILYFVVKFSVFLTDKLVLGVKLLFKKATTKKI